MSVIDSLRRQMVPIHPEGYIFIAGFAAVSLVLAWFWAPLGWIGAVLTLWCAYFFRDPPRVTPLEDTLIISPADGIVSATGLFTPPPELGLGEAPLPRVSVFMSVFDCHINRAPISGRVAKIAYHPGLFLSADLDKASEANERSGLVLETAFGRFGVVQIAGLVARRIVCFTHSGETLAAGERFGLIRFGSRVDIYMPHGVEILAGVGSRAIAGETVLADVKPGAVPRRFRRS